MGSETGTTSPGAEGIGSADERPEEAAGTELSGDRIQVHQGSAQTVLGKHVEIHQGGVQFVEGEQISIHQGGAMTVRGDRVELSNSGAVFVSADKASFVEESRAGVLFTNRIDGPQVKSGVIIARDIYGNVETQLDARGALLLGLGLGIGIGLLGALRSIFRSED